MKRLLSLALASGLLASLTACDYRNTPGKDPQASQDFSTYQKARPTETMTDSVSGGDEAYTPIGTGSANDQKTSVDAAIEGQPNNAGSPVGDMPSGNEEVKATSREQ
ncbi:hypothetical protein HNQ93_000018 [Hymenobacter luteus]|uniref:Lipoprotein n=2 Tax=Hymenobacter TaxID=89966 RepID=A0A7W9W9S6_9BACT|nr:MULTISPECIES: hypothetical protein [Hymenobacter]MBB4600502.1 hypothetical protein [Hymenobacter latericoloratus]MBB6057188.1 hypothetical protein [Hymenobacter luteus]